MKKKKKEKTINEKVFVKTAFKKLNRNKQIASHLLSELFFADSSAFCSNGVLNFQLILKKSLQ